MADLRAAAVNARQETRRASTRWIWREPGPDLRPQGGCVGGRQGLALAAGDPDEAEREPAIPGARTEPGRDVGGPRQAEEADDQIADGGHHVRPGLAADPAPILIEGDVADPMHLVLDRPMTTVEIEQACRLGLLGGKTADSIGIFGTESVPLEIRRTTMQAENLCGIRELEVANQIGTAAYAAGFNAAMSFGHISVLRGGEPRARGPRCPAAELVDCP